MRWREIRESTDVLASVSPEALAKLAAAGFDTKSVLYHGSTANFDVFDVKRLRTARHFYTSPSPDTARDYGPNVYVCLGIQDPQADLIDDWELIGKLGETYASEFYSAVEDDEDLQREKQELMAEWLQANPDSDEMDAEWAVEDSAEYQAALHQIAKRYVVDHLQSGELYGMAGRDQDNIMNECFGLGYRSVRFIDPSRTGESISVVFNHASDIAIVGRLP